MLQYGIEDQIVVEPGFDRVTADGQCHIIPATSLHTAWFDGCLRLTTTVNLLQSMLRVTPAAEIHPAVVMFVHVIEDDDETLTTLVLASAALQGIVVAHFGGTQGHALLAVARLTQYAVGDLPVANQEIGFSCLGQRVHVGERRLGAPGGIAHATLLRR